ncbi:MAG: GMC family oxidoreductase [Bradymonadaceae bacterium]|nr:GMC family oxidoreductase [Lujinxingiaceae bacterium]
MAGTGHARVLKAEVVVVGLGAGGAMALHDLAAAGVDVLGVEVGGYIDAQEMTLREEEMMPKLFAEAGARATDDFAINVMQGRGVGGSTLHNTNLCKRLPIEILEQWQDEYGVEGLLGDELQRDFADVERLLNVHPVPDDQVNPNNAALARGVEALGYRGARLSHNRKDCQQSGFCELGCPNDGKQNASKVLVPPALSNGARIVTDLRVDTLITRRGEVVGVRGHAPDASGRRDGAPVEIQAGRVVLAASATASAAIVKRSALPDPYNLAGTNLHLHPGAMVIGIFDGPADAPIEGWLGVPQSTECTEFLEFGPRASKRVWLVPGFAHPGAAAGFMPGFGPSHGQMMRLFPRVACIITMLHDHASGRVSPGRGEKVHISYGLDAAEHEQLALGMREAGRILLAAGASRVIIPLSPPRTIATQRELDQIRAQDLGPLCPPMAAVHPMSTLWMGKDPRRSVVDSRGEHHQVKGLFVADGSLFPTSIGGPPQIPIYTFGRLVARHVLDSLRR